MRRKIRYVVASLVILGTLSVVIHVFFIGKDQHHIIDDVALAMIAVLFAIQQFLDSGTQLTALDGVSKQLSTQLDTLSDVGRQLSTRYLAPFPESLTAIREFVSERRSNECLHIMVDFAGYGSFSNPEEFIRYRSVLEQSASNSKIKMLIYDDALARNALREQWPTLESFKTERAYPSFRDFFKNNRKLIDDWSTRKFGAPLKDFSEFEKSVKYEDQIELKLEAQKKIQDLLAERIEIRFMRGPKFAVHAWTLPDRVIFAFTDRSADLQELSFTTRDERLVRIFDRMFDRLWEENDPAKIQPTPATRLQRGAPASA